LRFTSTFRVQVSSRIAGNRKSVSPQRNAVPWSLPDSAKLKLRWTGPPPPCLKLVKAPDSPTSLSSFSE